MSTLSTYQNDNIVNTIEDNTITYKYSHCNKFWFSITTKPTKFINFLANIM